MAATIALLRAEADEAKAERAALKAAIERTEAQRALEANVVHIKINRELEALRSEFNQVKRDRERMSKAPAQELVSRTAAQSLELTRMGEVVSTQKSNVDILTKKLDGLEKALQEVGHQQQEENRVAIEQLRKKCEESESAERQRQVLLFEMVEAEALKREELATTFSKQSAKHESDIVEREESLLWFQEEIREELHKLQDRVAQKISAFDDVVEAMQKGQRSHSRAVTDQITSVGKHQDETMRQLVDQYLQTTLQLHELRTAIDKERQDRSQEFTTLLRRIQLVQSTSGAAAWK